VLAAILLDTVRLLAPVITFTAEEVWQHIPAKIRGDAASVQLAGWPESRVPASKAEEVSGLRSIYSEVLGVREAVTKALEEAREAKVIGKSQEAAVTIGAPSELLGILSARSKISLADMFIVSSVRLELEPKLNVAIDLADGEKCPRCWNVRELGTDTLHPDLCARCAAVIRDKQGET